MKKPHPVAVIVLAAGKGTRMKSSRAKVLHEVFYRPMLHHVLNAVIPLAPQKTVAVVGHQRQAVVEALAGYNVICAEQEEQNGTGHAVLSAEQALSGFQGTVLIVCGDVPLLLTEHLQEMLDQHIRSGSPLTIMTTSLAEPTGYGRIISDDNGKVTEIVEEKDATAEQRQITEINAGIYCAESSFLFKGLRQVTMDNSQGEMYLTDIVAIGVAGGYPVNSYRHPRPSHVLGVNSRIELAQANRTLQKRRNIELMAAGVTFENEASTMIGPEVQIAADCVLAPQVTITGTTSIGHNCTIGPGVVIDDATIGDNVTIGANSVIMNTRLKNGAVVEPLSSIHADMVK